MRPASIRAFEALYLLGWAVGLANTAIHWSALRTQPAALEADATLGSWYLPTATAVGLMIPLLLWYLVARRGSGVARWVTVVLTVVGAGATILALAAQWGGLALAEVLSLAATGLNLASLVMLFRADARAWFEGPAA